MTITTLNQLSEQEYENRRYELIKALEGEVDTAYLDNEHMAIGLGFDLSVEANLRAFVQYGLGIDPDVFGVDEFDDLIVDLLAITSQTFSSQSK